MGGVEETRQATKERLWAAVDSITRPTKQRIVRAANADWLAELADTGQGSFCRVADHAAAVLAYGEIPALWKLANWAVFGIEAGEGGGGSALRERSPADLDLMETLLTIRESLGWQLPGRGVAWRKPGDIIDMMRQFAAFVATNEPQHVEWWAYRFEQWARLLRTHLNALDDQGPKPRYLRNTACPLCRTRQVTVDRDGDLKVVPALVVDFVDKIVRCARCQACGTAWWRGAELEALAAEVRESDPAATVSA